jgi:hypothetical protein
MPLGVGGEEPHMTKLLEQAIAKISELPADEQDVAAAELMLLRRKRNSRRGLAMSQKCQERTQGRRAMRESKIAAHGYGLSNLPIQCGQAAEIELPIDIVFLSSCAQIVM